MFTIKHLQFSTLFIWKTILYTAVFWISSLLIQFLHLHCWLLTSSYLLFGLKESSLKSKDLTISSALGRHLSQGTWFLATLEVYHVCFQENMVLLQVVNPGTKAGRVGKDGGFLYFPKPGLLNTSALLCFQTFTWISLNRNNPFQNSAFFNIIFYTSFYRLPVPPLIEIWECDIFIYNVDTFAASGYIYLMHSIHFMLLPTFSWPHPFPRPSATSCISVADPETYLWVRCMIYTWR